MKWVKGDTRAPWVPEELREDREGKNPRGRKKVRKGSDGVPGVLVILGVWRVR